MKNKIYITGSIIISLLIGMFSGAIIQRDKEKDFRKESKNLVYNLMDKEKEKDYWKQRWDHENDVLRKISNHEDCTFELKSIIGELSE